MKAGSKKLLIIGSIPPPIGGVSIHIDRLIKTLQSMNVEFDFCDYKKMPLSAVFKKASSFDIIHIHFSNKAIRFLSVLLFRLIRKKVIVTYHGMYTFSNLFDWFSLKFASYSFVLNEFSYFNTFKANKSKKENIQIISAFIPPIEQEKLSKEMIGNIERVSANKEFTACTNATKYVENREGKDLYGIDFLLNIFKNRPTAALIISDPSGELQTKYSGYKDYPNILFISLAHPFVEVIKKSDVYIRASTSDGDSLSVKEALYYHVKVIASDCVDRPLGCNIYRLGDMGSLNEELDKPSEHKTFKIEDGALQVTQIYRKFLNIR